MDTIIQGERRSRGFTLVELLVVVSIIALLVGALVPSLSRARKQTKATVCQNNLRGLGLAVLMYSDTNREHLVTAGLAHGNGDGNGDGDAGHHEQDAWINTLRAEYGNELLARCPSDRSPHWTEPLPDGDLRRVSYAVNGYTVHRFGNVGPYDRLSVFKRPNWTIYIVDLAETGEFAGADNIHPETWFVNPRAIAEQQVAIERHLGRANYSFIDGHTERLRFEKTYAIDPAGGFPPVFIHNKYDPAVAR